MNKISYQLKSIRNNMSISTSEVVKKLAKRKLYYSPQSVYKWENGTALPPFETIKELAKIYKCSISYILDGKNFVFKRLTPSEIFLLNCYRNNFWVRSISIQLIKMIEEIAK